MNIDSMIMVDPSSLQRPTHCDYNFRIGAGLGRNEHHRSSVKNSRHKSYKNENDFFQSFVDAGRTGGLASKNRARFRLSLICRLVREVLYRQPLEFKLSASEVAYEIHDDFASEVRAHVDIYGNENTFGARDKKIHMPFLELITRVIRKQVKKGYELIKSKAEEFYPAPGYVPA